MCIYICMRMSLIYIYIHTIYIYVYCTYCAATKVLDVRASCKRDGRTEEAAVKRYVPLGQQGPSTTLCTSVLRPPLLIFSTSWRNNIKTSSETNEKSFPSVLKKSFPSFFLELTRTVREEKFGNVFASRLRSALMHVRGSCNLDRNRLKYRVEV